MLHQAEIYADIADIGEAGEAEDIEANELQTQATISFFLPWKFEMASWNWGTVRVSSDRSHVQYATRWEGFPANFYSALA